METYWIQGRQTKTTDGCFVISVEKFKFQTIGRDCDEGERPDHPIPVANMWSRNLFRVFVNSGVITFQLKSPNDYKLFVGDDLQEHPEEVTISMEVFAERGVCIELSERYNLHDECVLWFFPVKLC